MESFIPDLFSRAIDENGVLGDVLLGDDVSESLEESAPPIAQPIVLNATFNMPAQPPGSAPVVNIAAPPPANVTVNVEAPAPVNKTIELKKGPDGTWSGSSTENPE